MFLIEYEGKRILYSGDIRLTVSDLKNLVGTITNIDGSVITIDDLYLDTTFAVPARFENFPSREVSERLITDFVRESLSVSPGRKVVLHVSAKFGYESLFISLRKTFKKPIMVHDNILACYEDIEEIRDHVIGFRRSNNDDWLIHACGGPTECNVSQGASIIKPCALGFVKESDQDDIMVHRKYKVPYLRNQFVTKVFYATHCSLNELRDIFKYLKPKRVFPSVVVHQSYKETLVLIGAAGENAASNYTKETELPALALPSCRKRKHEERERRRSETRKRLGLSL